MESSTAALDGDGNAKPCTEPKGSAANRDGSTCSGYAEFGQKSKILGCFGEKVISHAEYLRNRIGGGKTSVQFRRFSSSKPTRLADGLGPIRLPFAGWRFAPRTWVPRSQWFSGLGCVTLTPLFYFVNNFLAILAIFTNTSYSPSGLVLQIRELKNVR